MSQRVAISEAQMKRKPPKKISPSETVHFRPGPELGRAIGDLATAWKTSRGDCAKRLASLALHGLDIDFYDTAMQLMAYSDTGDFDQACQRIHVQICTVESDRRSGAPLEKQEKLQIARELAVKFLFVHEIEHKAEQQRIKIKIYLE
jgi:hypothetical protein